MDADTPPLKDRIAELGALQEQLRISNQRVANLSALVEISKIINSTLDLDTLLTMIAANREWNEGAARAKLLKIFEATGLEDEWVVGVRRRLSRVLFG